MGKTRVRHSAEVKAKIALEALKGVKTVNELAGQYQVHPTQVSQWKPRCNWERATSLPQLAFRATRLTQLCKPNSTKKSAA